ncbi:AAA family ATPase [Nitrobacter hamburgensis]|uniref:AAA family ATPase n=1 Tax=Nitrobacter hamburgensis TaxID=912 RepID=UPI0002EFAAD6|nr:AAA family ATPase [Nitrobacter hamburgensis]
MNALQAKSFDPADLTRSDKVDQMGAILDGDIYVPLDPDLDIASLTMETIGETLRRESEVSDISHGAILTGDWHCKDRRVRNHHNFFVSWLADDDTTVRHKQLQGDPADAVFILEDLQRAAGGGEVRYRPEPKAVNEPVAANDNEPSAPSTLASTKPKLTADEEREYLENFQREQLMPGERGELVYDDAAWRALSSGPFWHIADAVIEGHQGDVFMGVLDGAPKFAPAQGGVGPITPLAPFPLVDPSEWHGTIAQVRQWFLTGLIPHRQVTLLSGDGGVGKSLLGLQIGAASALAIETLGLQPRPGRVLYLGAEDEAEEFHRRLDDIAAAHSAEIADLTDLRILPLADQDALLSEPDPKGNMKATPLWGRVDRFVKSWEPGLVVLDTAADLFGGDEVKRSQVRHFVAMLRKMAIERDCAVLLLAHPSIAGMASGSGYSGSTAWNNSVRSRLYLTSGEGDVRILKTVKSNYGKIGDEMQLEWCEGAFVLHDPSKPGIADGLINGRADKLFMAVLSKLNRTGQRPSPNKSPSYAPRMIQKHPDAKGTKVRDLEMAMQRLLDTGVIKIVEEGPASRRRSRLIVSAEDFGGTEDG